jgi:hypothetical protein
MMRNRSAGFALLMGAVALGGCGGGGGSKSASTTAPINSGSTGGVGSGATGNGATVAYAQLTQARADHTATALPQGVLVTGGEAGGKVLASAEVYQNGSWRAAGAMSTPRKGHTATLLSSGKVLICGGQSDVTGQQVLNTSELYDPATGAFTPGPLMQRARSGHVAVAYRQGQKEYVLIAGGASVNGTLASAEVYDVSLGQFVLVTAQCLTDRVDGRALLLPSGKVLIQGGLAGVSPQTLQITPAGAELFDPATQTFTRAGLLGIDRYGASLELLDAGRVLVAGGSSAARIEATAETYDAANNAWANVPVAMNVGREAMASAALPGGGILLAGGAEQAGVSKAVERYDAAQGQFVRLGDLLEARRDHTATRLPNGRILIVGGRNGQASVGTSEEYDPTGAAPATALVPTKPAGGVVTPTPTTPAPTGTPPSILALYPTKGKPGDLITIAGRDFAAHKADNVVLFAGNVRANPLFEVQVKNLPFLGAVQTLVVEVPQGAQTGNVVVLSNNLPSAPKTFTIDMQSGGTPQVLYTLPRRANVGSIVTIFGRNFARPASGNVVRFAGVQASLIGGLTTQSVPFLGNVAVMLVRVPQGAVTGDLTIEANGKVSNGYSFEVPGTTPSTSTTSTSSSSSSSSSTTTSSSSSSSSSTTTGQVTFFTEDFEGSTIRFSQSGSLWEASVPSAGPGRAASGQWCAGTAMSAGSYPANAHGFLISREIDLSQATQAELHFNQFFETDGVDAGRVLVTADQGQTYYLVRPNGGYLQTSIYSPGEGFAGQSGSWLATTVDLSSFLGQRIQVLFEFSADATGAGAGWYVDDVAVTGN